MPVRFNCNECHTLLSVGRRKIGERIECPKCGAMVTVPIIDAVTGRPVRPKTKSDRKLVPIGAGEEDDPLDDDPDAPISEYAPPPDPQAEAAQSPAEDSSESSSSDTPQPSPIGPPPRRGIVMSAGALVTQWAVFVMLAAGAFYGGYLLGQFEAAGPGESSSGPGDDFESILGGVIVEGGVIYQPNPGRVAPDAGSLVMLLPVDRTPEVPFSDSGLRPEETSGPLYEAARSAIERIGGGLSQVDEAGGFSLNAPNEGEYWTLIISRTARRRGGGILAEHQQTLGSYFVDPVSLIGDRKYVLTQVTINGPWALWKTHDFGAP